MSNEDGTLWIVFNGAIYNYVELRDELAGRGHRFRSRTDTEVILHLYEECGPECLERLNGMFALAIWDTRTQTLFAARDRFGIKPFYYCNADGRFAFASEIKAFFESGCVVPELDRHGVADYVTFQFCLGDKTMFRGVRKLEPGCWLQVGRDNEVRIQRFWALDFTIAGRRSAEMCREELDALLDDAVRLQLRADVPVGTHVSGGLDSSVVTCLAARHTGSVHAFTGAFRDGPEFDESAFAGIVADATGATHRVIVPTEVDFVAALPRIVYHMDEPAAGPGVFPQFAVSAAASESVRVVLGGQGGDELFGGYTRYLILYLEACLKGAIDGTQERGRFVVTFGSIVPNLAQLRGYEPLMRHFWSEGLFDAADRRYLRLIDRGSVARGCLDPEVVDGRDYDVVQAYSDLFHSGDCGSLINRMTHFDLNTLLPALLHVEDRSSMAAALESRVPLLDHRIAELVASMPPTVKFAGGRSKHILREVAAGIVPPAISARQDKMGFPVPLKMWLRRGPVREFVRDVLLGRRARQRGVLNPRAVEAALANDGLPERDLWGLLNLELWMQTFIDGYRGAVAVG